MHHKTALKGRLFTRAQFFFFFKKQTLPLYIFFFLLFLKESLALDIQMTYFGTEKMFKIVKWKPLK